MPAAIVSAGAPAAPAPASTGANGKAPAKAVGGEAGEAGGEEPDVWADLDTTLKKHKGIEVKVHGKPRRYDSADTIRQRLSLTDALELKVNELTQDGMTAKERAALVDALEREEDPKKLWEMLEGRLGKKLFGAAQSRFRELIAKDKEDAALTENERRLKAEKDAAEERASKLERDHKAAQAKEEQARYEARARQNFQAIARITAEATKDMGLKASAAPYITPHIAAAIARADQLGLEITPGDLSREIHGAMGQMSTAHLSALTDEALLDHLLGTKTKDEDGKTEVTLFMRALRAYQARRKARHSVDDGEVENEPPEPKPDRGATKRVSKDADRRGVMSVFRPPPVTE